MPVRNTRYSNDRTQGTSTTPNKNETNTDTSSKESGVDNPIPAGDFSSMIYPEQQTNNIKVEEPDYFGKGFVDWWKPYNFPTVDPNTQDNDTNNVNSENSPSAGDGVDNTDQTIQDPESNKVQPDNDQTDNGRNGSNGNGNGNGDKNAGLSQPDIVRIVQAQIDDIASKLADSNKANTDAMKTYTDKVNTSLMEEINGLYEANGKQNELNDLIIDATNQKWMTQLGDEIVPLQNYDAFNEPEQKTSSDLSATLGKYKIWIIVGVVLLIGLSLLKGKGSGSGTGVNVTRYG